MKSKDFKIIVKIFELIGFSLSFERMPSFERVPEHGRYIENMGLDKTGCMLAQAGASDARQRPPASGSRLRKVQWRLKPKGP